MSEQEKKKPEVKLSGTDANVFAIVGACQRAAQRAGWERAAIHAFVGKCLNAPSYDDVLKIIFEEFEVS